MIATLLGPRTRGLEWLVELAVMAMLPSMAEPLIIGARLMVHGASRRLASVRSIFYGIIADVPERKA